MSPEIGLYTFSLFVTGSYMYVYQSRGGAGHFMFT